MNLSLGNSLPLAVSGAWLPPLWLVALGVVVAVAAGVRSWCSACGAKVAAIAWTTAKEALCQPLFYVLLGSGRSCWSCSPSSPTTPSAKTSRWSKRPG